MCRMISAVGRADAAALASALKRMAANDNPAHAHEKRSLGAAHMHEDGWGIAWRQDGGFRIERSIRSCVTDPSFETACAVGSDLVLLHARRAPEGWPVVLTSTHPFTARFNGQSWVFCHNGLIRDVAPLVPAAGLAPGGDTDSERLFHHLLARLDPSDPGGSLLAALAPVRDYSSLHCFMATPETLVAISQRHPDDPFPEHHALWEGRGPDLRVVSSEPVDGIGCSEWRRMGVPEVLIVGRTGR